MTDEIYVCNQLYAPSRKDDSVDYLCKVSWTRSASLKDLSRKVNPVGTSYYQLDYDIEMKVQGPTIEFTILHNGQRFGGHNVELDFA